MFSFDHLARLGLACLLAVVLIASLAEAGGNKGGHGHIIIQLDKDGGGDGGGGGGDFMWPMW